VISLTSPDHVGVDETAALRFTAITKAFGASAVLNDVTFDIHRGEIHALLGVNGAGKSTLIKILAGVHHQDAGTISVHGRELHPGHSPDDVRDAGIAFVHQDLGLVEDLSVSDNIALHVGFERRRGLVNAKATTARVAEILASVGATFSPDELVSTLSRDEQVLCAIARALALEPSIVVLDEVSASLPGPEVERLAASLRQMRGRGTTFIYVTHRLEELPDLVDRVTVLRNGTEEVTAPMNTLTRESLVKHILGAETLVAEASVSEPGAPGGEVRLTVRDLTTADLLEPMSFEIRAGEILGICGLVGSGTRELARALAGPAKPTGGSAALRNKPLPLGRPEAMGTRSCHVVPGDRQREGILTGLALRENLLPTRRTFGAWTRLGFRKPRGETAAAQRACQTFGVVPRDDVDRDVSELSGGNQQKLVFARALADQPDFAVLEDPTAGVDIGSRATLYALMHESAQAGTAIALISTDFEEVAAQSHRVIVLKHGRIEAEFADASQISADRLARASFGEA
jgi:ribose transport system ATP-binding protein